MVIRIDYIQYVEKALITNDSLSISLWRALRRTIADSVPQGSFYYDDSSISLSWRLFLSVKVCISDFLINHEGTIKLVLSEKAKKQLKKVESASYERAIKNALLPKSIVIKKLEDAGFVRHLTNNQLNNVCKIASLPGAATFSVPGAGKTTEALAYFAINAHPSDRLLVVAPKNAFGAWDEQIEKCFGCHSTSSFVRLRGGENNISELLKTKPRFMIITYEQLSLVKELMTKTLCENPIIMFLDESHKIKGGKTARRAEAILQLAHLPIKKLIMSGTPMPQSPRDLVAQFLFLYPAETVNEDTVTSLIQPLYVRTTKTQLNIPPLTVFSHKVHFNELQRELYNSLKSEVKRQLIPYLSDGSRMALRHIGKCVIKLMEFVSNPSLLASDLAYVFDQRLGSVLLSSDGPKISYVCERARNIVSQGKKVIIWSNFVSNVELLALRLSDLGAVYIHGHVDAGDEEEEDTREWKIKRFKEDNNCKVFIGNPAACSEGISLHEVCQYAIYLDRSFNAAQFLQSEDRIHRLGLPENAKPTIEIVECVDTIDQVIEFRLKKKIKAMATVLNDSSLQVDPIDFDDEESDIEEIDTDDAKEVLKYFFPEDVSI